MLFARCGAGHAIAGARKSAQKPVALLFGIISLVVVMLDEWTAQEWLIGAEGPVASPETGDSAVRRKSLMLLIILVQRLPIVAQAPGKAPSKAFF